MAWKIEWSAEAMRDISGLERKDAVRIVRKMESAAKDPYRHFQRLRGADDFKLRVGDYRILVLLDHGTNTIFIEKVGHRKNIYKR